MENCCVCLTRNFGHQVSETTLLIVKIRFVPKSQRKSILCSREISLKRRQIVTRTFARTFLESSREQRTKFAHFACVTFAQYCIINKALIEKKIIRILLYDIFVMIIHKSVGYCDSKWSTHSETELLMKDTRTKF